MMEKLTFHNRHGKDFTAPVIRDGKRRLYIVDFGIDFFEIGDNEEWHDCTIDRFAGNQIAITFNVWED